MLFEDTKEKNHAGRIALNKLVSHMVCMLSGLIGTRSPSCASASQPNKTQRFLSVAVPVSWASLRDDPFTDQLRRGLPSEAIKCVTVFLNHSGSSFIAGGGLDDMEALQGLV